MKQCRKCNQTKPLEEYSRNPNCSDGHFNICKQCTHSRVVERRGNAGVVGDLLARWPRATL